MCCEGKEIDFKELKSPEMEALQKSLFPGIISMLQQGPQMPQFPINAPNDDAFGKGMNMFYEMAGMEPNYTPYQAPQYWNPAWTPNWGNFPGYGTHDWKPGPPPITDEERDRKNKQRGSDDLNRDDRGKVTKPIQA